MVVDVSVVSAAELLPTAPAEEAPVIDAVGRVNVRVYERSADGWAE